MEVNRTEEEVMNEHKNNAWEDAAAALDRIFETRPDTPVSEVKAYWDAYKEACGEDFDTTNPVIARAMILAGRWEIRRYAEGQFDAAETNGTAISPGLDSFDAAVKWACEQEAAAELLGRSGYADERAPAPSYHVEWLGAGFYRSDLYGVYDRNSGELDDVRREKQLFRGTREECEAWVETKTQLRWLQDHPYASGTEGEADRLDALLADLEGGRS